MGLTCWAWLVAIGSAGVANAEMPHIGCNGRSPAGSGMGGDNCEVQAAALNKLDGVSGVGCDGDYPFLSTGDNDQCVTVAATLNRLIGQPVLPVKNTTCVAAETACAKDRGCQAFGVYGNDYQLHGCADAAALTPNVDWRIFVPSSPSKTAWQPVPGRNNVDEKKCKIHPSGKSSGHCKNALPPASSIFCEEALQHDQRVVHFLASPNGDDCTRLTALLQGPTCKHGNSIPGPSGGGDCTGECDQGFMGGNCDTPTVSCTAATWNTSQCTAETCPASAPGPFKCVGGAATGACQPALWPKNSSCSKCVDLSNCGSCSDTNHGAKGGLYHDQGCNLFTPGGGSPWPQPIPGCTDPDYDISGEGKDDFSARKMCCVCGGGARPHGHKPSRCPPPPGPSTCERVLRFDCEADRHNVTKCEACAAAHGTWYGPHGDLHCTSEEEHAFCRPVPPPPHPEPGGAGDRKKWRVTDTPI